MEYILIICTLAVGHSLFLAVALLVISKKLSNRLLALLLFLLTLRIGKSVVGMFLLPGMSYELSTIGVIAMAALGPVLFLLIKSLFISQPRFSVQTCLHFMSAILLLIALPLSGWKIVNLVYYSITGHLLAYISLCWWFIFWHRETFKADDTKWRWAIKILAGTSLLWCSFALQITVYRPLIYATNVIIAAVVFYGLSLWAIKHSKLFLGESSGKPENTEALIELGKRIQHLLEIDQIFIDSNLTVSLLATKIKAQPYLVSKAINHFFKKSFSEVLVHYRIKKAEQLLLSPESKTFTIEGIAFESGFNTLSAFYSAFKKIHKTTPAQFREAKGMMNMKIA